MKISRYRASNLGSFAPLSIANMSGYVTYHDSPRYAKATDEQLQEWAECSSIRAVRNAAITEQCERRLLEWQRGN